MVESAFALCRSLRISRFGPGVVDDQFYALVVGQIADDFGADPGDGFKPAGPIAVVVRPG